MTVLARAAAPLLLTTGDPLPGPVEACTGRGTGPSSVKRERMSTALRIAERETTSPSRSMRMTVRSVEMRWCATVLGSAVGRCEGDTAAAERDEVAAAGFGLVE